MSTPNKRKQLPGIAKKPQGFTSMQLLRESRSVKKPQPERRGNGKNLVGDNGQAMAQDQEEDLGFPDVATQTDYPKVSSLIKLISSPKINVTLMLMVFALLSVIYVLLTDGCRWELIRTFFGKKEKTWYRGLLDIFLNYVKTLVHLVTQFSTFF